MKRFAQLGVVASVQPVRATSDMKWVDRHLSPDRAQRSYAWNRLRNIGASLAFGSDAPVEPIDPLRGFYAAVTRRAASGVPPGGWHPDERLPQSVALHAYMKGAAYAAFEENDIGSIEPGKCADFVILSQDIMTVPANELLETEVLATYVDGQPTYSSQSWLDP